MFYRLFFLCFLMTGGLLASAQDINQQVKRGDLYNALRSILFVEDVVANDIENTILRQLREVSLPWTTGEGQIFLNRLPELPTISTIQAALINLDGQRPQRTLAETGRQNAFHGNPLQRSKL